MRAAVLLTALLALSACEEPSLGPAQGQRRTSDGRQVRWDPEDCLWRDVRSGRIVLLQHDSESLRRSRACFDEQTQRLPRLLPKDQP